MQKEKMFIKVTTVFPGEYRTEDGRMLYSGLNGTDCGQDGYLADPETGEVFEACRNPETEEVEGVYELVAPGLKERLEGFYGKPIDGIHAEGSEEVDTGAPVGEEVW